MFHPDTPTCSTTMATTLGTTDKTARFGLPTGTTPIGCTSGLSIMTTHSPTTSGVTCIPGGSATVGSSLRPWGGLEPPQGPSWGQTTARCVAGGASGVYLR